MQTREQTLETMCNKAAQKVMELEAEKPVITKALNDARDNFFTNSQLDDEYVSLAGAFSEAQADYNNFMEHFSSAIGRFSALREVQGCFVGVKK